MTRLLGIDLGSTVVKAVVFDLRGRVVASAQARLTTQRPRAGWVERDPRQAWRVTAAVIRRAVRGHAGAITAIGVTGCGNGAVFLGARGQPLRPGILSGDRRTSVRAVFPGNQSATYPGQLAALLPWFRRAEPALARKLHVALFWKDYLRFRLTGLTRTDYTDAGASGLFDSNTRRWRSPDPALPSLQASEASAGCISARAARATGLKTGTPVYTGCIDCEAAALGSGVRDAGEISVVAGTWAINQAYVRGPVAHAHFLVNASVRPDRKLVMEGSPSSAANFDWAVQAFTPGRDAAHATALARRAPRSSLRFVPKVPAGQGAFLGLAPEHGPAELLRAVMEGVAFAHRAHLEKLRRSTGPWRRIILSGGIARSPAWCQLFANLLGCPVGVPAVTEVGALGAALLAGVGAGRLPSLAAAQRAMTRSGRTFRPDRAERQYLARQYRAWLPDFSLAP